MPLKKGGGNELQEYDSRNGEYCRNKQCEEDEKNLVLQKIFGINTGKTIVFPIPNIHDDEYCELYIKYCVNKKNQILQSEKFTNYLFKKREVNDKSSFLNSMGYYEDEYNKVINQIIGGTNFKEIFKIRNSIHGLTFATRTKIYNHIKQRTDSIITVWQVYDNYIRFIGIKGGENEL